MPIPDPAPEPPLPNRFPLPAAAELQDHLLAVDHDLDRLQALLAHAAQTLIGSFHAARAPMHASGDAAALGEFERAVPALQFQDLASQLVAHARQRLRLCVDQIACQTFAGDDGEYADDAAADVVPLRSNPVTQCALGAGSVELF